VNAKQAEIRTAHTLIGTGVLAAAVVLALRVGSRSAVENRSGGGRVVAAKVGHPTPALALTAPGETP